MARQQVSSVGICIATLDRPAQLAQLLSALGRLNPLADADGSFLDVVVAVADNDPAGSAKPIVDGVGDEYPHRVLYQQVREPGVVYARNASILLAGDVDWLAFIDDDEVPAQDWLTQLLRTAIDNNAAVVAGPVPEHFEGAAPPWYLDAGLDLPETQPTGSSIKRFGVGNALICSAALQDLAGPFDVRFNLTGGEDVHLGFLLQQRGHQMVWCEDAVATTLVPVERTEFRWVMRRHFNAHRNYSRALRLTTGKRSWGEVSRSFARLLEALFWGTAGVLRRDRGSLAKSAHLGAGALGKFAGTFEVTSRTTWW
ncbi:MAG: glycosyltransferase [Acidimicrobiales bacterium]